MRRGVVGIAVVLLAALLSGAGQPGATGGPVNTTPPSVTGDPTYREVLRADPGSWTPAAGLTLTFRWFRDGRRLRGETGRTYRPRLADLGARLAVRVVATDPDGLRTGVTSGPTTRVRRAELSQRRPPRVRGTTRYTQVLTADPGAWSRRPHKVRYRWLRGGRPIAGATGRRHRLQPADVGRRIRVAVTVRAPGHRTARARSRPTGRIAHRVPVRRSVTYRIETRGAVVADRGVFRRQVAETFADPRGWRSAGVRFTRVSRGGDFSVVLAEAGRVPSFSPVCSSRWSCRVGRYVIINQDRWRFASPSWSSAGRRLRDYRHMVLNHETGHWLGHGHLGCPGRGRAAPVMMQQSKGLGGCRHNPWPLASELWYR